jgi:hypothetical protein
MPIRTANTNGYLFTSNEEKELYFKAKESVFFSSPDRFLLHSLLLSKPRDKKLFAEIDFVYLDQDCILFLEVKGGQVKYDSLNNKRWVMGGTEKKDPFMQAYSALFQTRDNLLPMIFSDRNISNRLTYGIGVLFPECFRPKELNIHERQQMQYDKDLIYDYNDHVVTTGFINYLKRIKEYWQNHKSNEGKSGISQRELKEISKVFRQDLHFILPVSDILKKIDENNNKFTGMQMYILDNLRLNNGKGAIIMGGPGTGKTILALEFLKALVQSDKKVLFVCFNKNLAEHLEKSVNQLGLTGDYLVSNIHKIYFCRDFISQPPNENFDNPEFWVRDLPLFFKQNLNIEKEEYFDYIIIDEGQDILNEFHFEALGKLLKGNLESGNWTIFLDKEYQSIYNDDADDFFEYIKEVYPCFINVLSVNCRNTKSILRKSYIQTDIKEAPCLREEDIWKSEITFYNSEKDLINRVNDKVLQLKKEGVSPENITVLCFEKNLVKRVVDSAEKRFIENHLNEKKKINVTTVHSFKGLENKFVIICGPENYNLGDKKQMSLIHIANTRATAQSIFFLNEKFSQIILDRVENL